MSTESSLAECVDGPHARRLLSKARETAGHADPVILADGYLSGYLGTDAYETYVDFVTATGVALADTFAEAEAIPLAALPGITLTRDEVREDCARRGVLDPHLAVADAKRKMAAKVRQRGADEDRPRLWTATDLHASQQREWLARGHLPKAAVTLLVGDEGIGKSLMWVWLVGFITTGKPCPEYGIPPRDPADVIVVVTEDGWSDTVRPRLEVAGADLNRVHVIAEGADGSGSPIFPDHLDVIESAPVTPALIVVDAWLDTVPSGLSVRDPQQARQALHPWKELATSNGAAVLLLTHTNRVATANARDKYGATAELRKKARMTLFAQADPDNAGCMLVGPEKSNIARGQEASRFRINSVQHFPATSEDDGTVPLLSHEGTAGKTSRDLIAETFHGPDDTASELDEAIEWLTDTLSTGKQPSKAVKDAAAKAGISERTIKRASKDIGVLYTSEGFPRTTSWSLPGVGDPLAAVTST